MSSPSGNLGVCYAPSDRVRNGGRVGGASAAGATGR